MMKKTKSYVANIVVGLISMILSAYEHAQELPVKIIGIRSSKGSILINVFRDQAGYEKEVPFKQYTFRKLPGKTDLSVELNLEPGRYGFTLVDDENENKKIDKNFMGIHKEGFGFSNFFMTKMKKPSFEDFKIDWTKSAPVEIRVKYM